MPQTTSRWLMLFMGLFVAAASHAEGTAASLDVLARWQATHMRDRASAEPRRGAAWLYQRLLEMPDSAYSPLVSAPAFTNETDWADFVDSLPADVGSEGALAMLQYDLGATRARPARDIHARPGFRDAFVAASATKAGIDPDIFWHALDMEGFRRSTRAATYAIGLQILREAAKATASRPRDVGVDIDVLDRFMQARQMDELNASDLRYLSILLQHGLLHWRAGAVDDTGRRLLPVALRIARVAAAYRDAQGYIGGSPCHADATANPRYAGSADANDDRPLCFVAATDHAVQRWYVAEVRRQAAWRPPPSKHDRSGLVTLFALLMPLFDLATLVEVAEASAAEDASLAGMSDATDAANYSNEVAALACQIP
jgi:hypothetical protein